VGRWNRRRQTQYWRKILRAIRYTNTNSDSNGNSDYHTNSYCNTNFDCNTDSYCNNNSHCNTDFYRYTDSHYNSHANGDNYSNSYWYSFTYTNSNWETVADAKNSAHAKAAPDSTTKTVGFWRTGGSELIDRWLRRGDASFPRGHSV
jgi:hypothetical protein